MPFLNYGGPLGDDHAVKALAGEAVRIAESGGVKLLELRSRIPLPLDLPVSHRKITVVLDLPENSEVLFKAIPAKVRSQVRRPQKEGVTVRFGPDQVDPFFSVFSRHMRDLGTPTLPLGFFRAIAKEFGEDAWFGCAWLNDQPIACGAGFAWGREYEMTWASSLSEHNRIAPNMLVYWSFMERAIAAKLKVFNFGRCTPDGGTLRFKRLWGSRDETLQWYQPARGAALVLITVAAAVAISPLAVRWVGEGVAPPGPIPTHYFVIVVPTTFFLAIVFGGWPFTLLSRNRWIVALLGLAAAYAVTYALFRVLFNYDAMRGAPVYLASAPHGMFDAVWMLVCYVTVLAGMFVLLHFDLWPLTRVEKPFSTPMI